MSVDITRPPGETDFIYRIPAEVAEKYADWTDIAAFRIQKLSETEVELLFTNDLERITDPEEASSDV